MNKRWIFSGLVLLVLFSGCVQEETTTTTSTSTTVTTTVTTTSTSTTTTTTTTTNAPAVPGYYITTPPFCSDTDGGVNSAIKGSVTVDIRGEGIRSSFRNQTDYCFDQSTLIEYACDCYGEHLSDCITEAIAQEDIDCPHGCLDGACI
jgi:hypothetical protein